ncbi:hypothetical protein [Telluribacter sp.]|jgi:hypothetical protein|uniref:hypothetical protein n=1 Tax=Telluribacter sp. TaxID=1978767 RepID=UPI002E115264|nr:hypothetical protein [Telluribacter sp.]
MRKTIFVLAMVLSGGSASAQSPGQPVATVTQGTDTVAVKPAEKTDYYFPGHVPITMGDGSLKPISAVQTGDIVKCYRNGQLVTTRVQQVDVQENTCAAVTELYLRPVDERTASRSTWPLVPALLLEATPSRPVQTGLGPKAVQELVKGDVLYHFEAATGGVSAWKVGIIQANASTLTSVYNLITEAGSYLVENMVVLNK